MFAILAERALGPRLYGVFPQGRLEQYIPVQDRVPTPPSHPVLLEPASRGLLALASRRGKRRPMGLLVPVRAELAPPGRAGRSHRCCVPPEPAPTD